MINLGLDHLAAIMGQLTGGSNHLRIVLLINSPRVVLGLALLFLGVSIHLGPRVSGKM